jgi:hypothetical protein
MALAALLCLLGVLGSAQNVPQKAQSVVTADDFNQFPWRWIGPMTFSGRFQGITVPRGQSQTYYALSASGGLWKTVDGGIHFEPIFDKYGTLSMGYMAIAPSNQNILYLGTGEPMHARSSTHGNGIWKSTDAGKTWTKIGLEKSYFIPKVAVDFKNPDIVFAAAEGITAHQPARELALQDGKDQGRCLGQKATHVPLLSLKFYLSRRQVDAVQLDLDQLIAGQEIASAQQ